MERITLAAAEGERTYGLFAPTTSLPVPLVMFLHGAGGSAEWADDETGWSRLAKREGFALVLPEGLPPHPEKPPKFLTNPLRWNDGSPGPTGFPSTSDDVAFLNAVLDDAARRTAIDSRRVFVCGFSNGAGMTFRFASEAANRLAGIAPVAGYCGPNPRPSRPVPTLYMIGTADPLVPLRGGDVRSPWLHRFLRRPSVMEGLERWATAIGCDVIPRMESDSHGVRVERYPGPVEFRTIMVEGLGHHWPGGLGRLDEKIGGTPSNKVNGTEEIWRFFQKQTLN